MSLGTEIRSPSSAIFRMAAFAAATFSTLLSLFNSIILSYLLIFFLPTFQACKQYPGLFLPCPACLVSQHLVSHPPVMLYCADPFVSEQLGYRPVIQVQFCQLCPIGAPEHIVATYDLIYNAAQFVKKGFGYVIALDRIINTTGDSNLCFKPLSPTLEAELCIVWKKYQVLSRASSAFLQQLKAET